MPRKRRKKKRENTKQTSKEFLLFSTIPISIKTVILIRITIAVHLIIPFAIHVFKCMRAELAFFGGYLICFLVIHATPYFLSIMFDVVSSIAFSTPKDIRVTTKCQMTPFPAVLIL